MRRLQTIRAYLFLFPFLAFFIIVTAYPVLYGGYLSFFGQHGARMWFVGLSNYKSVFMDPLFWQGFGMPVFLLLVQVPGMILIAIFIGLLYERVRHSIVYRIIFYLPYAVPGIVAGILWSYIFSKSMSPLVALWKLFGVAKPEFITLSSVRWILLIIILWEWTGFTSLIIYSTLVSLPKEYAEAAEMDGATWLKVAYYIKIPLLRNTVFVLFIFNIFGAMQVFNEPRMINILLTLPANFTPAMYIYNQAFAYGAFTYSIAMCLVLAAVIFIVSFFFMRQSMKELDVHA
ncbi:MAG: sugar ABC transporter permease [Spirochaetia bacterium]|jgi:multiple sugar transport system permease protein